MEKTSRDYTEIRKVLSEGGTRFDYLFDVLDSLNAAIKGKEPSYLLEKIEYLGRAAKIVQHDVSVWAIRKKILEQKDVQKYLDSEW